MCFSAKVSLFTFITGMIGAILCVSLGKVMDIVIGLLLGYVSLMQLIEYLLWNHQICDNYNKIISIIGMLLNHFQPIVLGIILLYVAKPLPKNKCIILIIMMIYTLCAIPYSILFLQDSNNHCTLKNNMTKHLEWKWNEENHSILFYSIFLLSVLLLFLFGMPKIIQGVSIGVVIVILYLTSAFIYDSQHIGSMWCFFGALVPIFYYILRCVKKLKNIFNYNFTSNFKL